MRKFVYLSLLIYAYNVSAQETDATNTSAFQLDDKGLNFSFNEGDYEFNINGFIQPSMSFEKTKGQESISKFNAKRTFFMVSGKAAKEKISFLIQTDFSLSQPLLDAWIAYQPYSWLTLTGGQKQSFLNNREMIYREDKLQFTDRSRVSQLYNRTGREFGLFIETKFGEKFGIAPQLAITSGDGRNSFGSDSRDSDLGGLKIGGRLDIYPLGYFTPNNDKYTADLAHEKTIKVLAGVAASKNKGVSNAVGEGHGDFLFYDTNGKTNLVDYSQVFSDILIKYKGFSFLAEYANASVSNINMTFIDETATTILAPQQISNYLVVGDSYSLQAGYVTTKGLSFDVRYENTQPEFKTNNNSLLPDANSFTFGITKYVKQNNIKIQAALTTVDYNIGESATLGEIVVQIGF
ncbi:hypothetical protein [Flavobacterium sp. J27]|uniref:hypothetical protein n=1 Tax=Flavobacterium sp. J27 TaxID=2060419 RepID=UPI0010322532|nr:hypothetical protein [Flavobacterium sp. J27]